MKHDCFYEGLNPEFLQMLAHKVDGENPTSYSDLLLATQKLERWAESRDPLPQKMAMTNELNVIHSQTPGSLFPSCKLKGNYTFTAWAVTIGNDVAEEDPGMEQEVEGETEPSADGEVKTSGGVEESDQSVKYIAYFTKTVELYQKKNKNCFGCGSPDHLVWDCPKDFTRPVQKVYLNTKEGTMKKRGWAPQNPAAALWASPDEIPQA